VIKTFPFLLIFCVLFGAVSASLFAAPLEGGFALAPRASATSQERDQAYIAARLRVIEASRKYLGVPYRYGGMTATGLDCSGFIGLSFRDALGVTIPRSASGLFTWAVRIPLDRAQPGDLLFFRTGTGNNITHVGLYLGERVFIHAASAGPRTGVIYSTLDERYWANTFAGAGRAFPESTPFSIDSNVPYASANTNNTPRTAPSSTRNTTPASGSSRRSGSSGGSSGSGSDSDSSNGRLLISVAVAPIWNGFINGGDLVRGISSQFCLSAETYSFGSKMVFGLEIRPEYDHALGVFRLPVTLSWGPSDQIRIFAGPMFTFGDASITTQDGQRNYSSGTSWFGTIGFTAIPFAINTSGGVFSPYAEVAWQAYLSDNNSFDLLADFSAGFRFSTGIRWIINVRNAR
jgi:probable lipoprotein NlpC